MASRFDSDRSLDTRLRPYVLQVYRSLFPGSRYQPMEELGDTGLMFDKNWGVDGFICTASLRCWVVQSKCRRHDFLTERRYQVISGIPDFTQEFMNAAGTQYEAPGEWFHLNAELYFFGWATSDESGLAKWLLLDIPRYKAIVEAAGGLAKIGRLQQNKAGGKASFYAIPVTRLRDAWLATYREGWIVPPEDDSPAPWDDEQPTASGPLLQQSLLT